MDKQKIFYIESDKLGKKSFTLSELETKKLNQRIKIESLQQEYIHLWDARISHFSSGQYAKFTFLSKL